MGFVFCFTDKRCIGYLAESEVLFTTVVYSDLLIRTADAVHINKSNGFVCIMQELDTLPEPLRMARAPHFSCHFASTVYTIMLFFFLVLLSHHSQVLLNLQYLSPQFHLLSLETSSLCDTF